MNDVSQHLFAPSQWWTLLGNRDQPWLALDGLSRTIDATKTEIAETAWVHPTAIVTNSVLGDGVKVYEGAVVRDSFVGPNATVGHCSEVARSIVLADVMIPRFNYVGSSILGAGVHLGGAVMLASRRHDNRPVVLNYFGTEVRTEVARFGSLVGDGTTIAYGCHVNPGTVIGARTEVMALIDLRGFVPSDSMVLLRQQTRVTKRRRLPRPPRQGAVHGE